MDGLTEKYDALVARIRGYGQPRDAELWMLAEIEAIYRRERAATLAGRAATPSGQGGK